MILLDTSGLLALLDVGEKHHKRTYAALERCTGPRITTDFVLAEVDYLVLKRLGVDAELRFLEQVTNGAVRREPVTTEDLQRAEAVIRKYRDQALGLTDATLVAVAERLKTRQLLTLDRRHFSVVRTRHGAFQLYP